MGQPALVDLLGEYERALDYTESLWRDLTADEVCWRPHERASAIGWHLGHHAAVAHFMVRNLLAAEPSPDPGLDGLMDSATPESARGALPNLGRLADYRAAVSARVRDRVLQVDRGETGAPNQLRSIAATVVVAVINHEYQHDRWIEEVRTGPLGHAPPRSPTSPLLTREDGYLLIRPQR